MRRIIKPEPLGSSSDRANRTTSNEISAADQDVRNAIGTAIAAMSSLVFMC